MTQQFILDENVFICAQLETNVHGEPDETCLKSAARDIWICHPIVFDSVLYEKISAPTQPAGPASIWIRLGNPAHLGAGAIQARQAGIPGRALRLLRVKTDIPQGSQDDKFIVRLAVESGATLVTADEALRDDLASSSIQKRYVTE